MDGFGDDESTVLACASCWPQDRAESGDRRVQFLESSFEGLRSAVYELASPNYKTRIVLFPMIHIADRSFYAAIRERMASCDVLLFEGVRSFRVRLLTLSYKIPARRKSLGLVLQAHELRTSEFSGLKVSGDVEQESFGVAWREIPWKQRSVLLLLAPLYGCYLYLFGSRGSFARRASVDSIADRDAESSPAFDDVIGHQRDRRLIQKLESLLLVEDGVERKIAVTFGGRHMPAVASELMSKHGYRVVNSDWIVAIKAAG